ncbi:MAG: triose-phosphate isomerase [Caldilineaceae bacterium]
MNKTIDEAVALATAIRDSVDNVDSVDRVNRTSVCLRWRTRSPVRKSRSARRTCTKWQRIYTGEISAAMLDGLVSYVIIGHSERRQYFAETDETVNKKVRAALAAGEAPIMCVGESVTAGGGRDPVLRGRAGAGRADRADDAGGEPGHCLQAIWAIGTGLATTPEQAQDVCGDVVRGVLDVFGDAVAANTRVLYGGSTNDKNITEIVKTRHRQRSSAAQSKVDSYSSMVTQTAELYG